MKKSTTKKIEEYTDLAVEKTVELLAIDSPTCFTDMAADWVTTHMRLLSTAR